jgi:uncharacterized membrane protein YeaQ/YmgE (transglycosylase-associated protein family)
LGSARASRAGEGASPSRTFAISSNQPRSQRTVEARLPNLPRSRDEKGWVFAKGTSTLPASTEIAEENMFHLIWYILVGLIAGLIAKSVLHVHLTIFWTIVLGIIGSIIGGAVTHLFARPTNERFHPAGIIFSTLGAIILLYLCYKLKIRFPRIG